MKIDLNQHSFCFSVSLWRQFVMKRAFADRGLVYPKLRNPIQVSVATRANEPKAYSALALNFLELLFEAHAQELPYIVIFEDDAYPCRNPQMELDAILAYGGITLIPFEPSICVNASVVRAIAFI